MEMGHSPPQTCPVLTSFPPKPQQAVTAFCTHVFKAFKVRSFLSKSCFHLSLYPARPSPSSLPRLPQLDAISLGQTFPAPVPTPYPPHPRAMGPLTLPIQGP